MMTLFAIATAVALAAQSPSPPPGAAPASAQQPAATAPVPAGSAPQPIAPAGTPAPFAHASEDLRLQVMLDRAGFSPGPIDGRNGVNTKKALALYQQQRGNAGVEAVEPLTSYTISEQDAAGPFVPEIPKDLVQQASLERLAYTSMLEALAERFHSTPALLQELNPGARFAAGEQIQVPNVEPLVAPVERPEFSAESEAAANKEAAAVGTAGRNRGNGRAATRQPNTVAQRLDVVVTVSKQTSALTVRDPSGRVLMYAPVTTGSEHDPLPLGEWKVNGIQFNPVFNYNPDLFWDADPSHAKAKIPSGPNNPVGLVWIDLSKDHYGIHGTPDPSSVGRAQSHGCVRLTNWDALKLAGMVKPGTKVVFTE